MKEYDFLTAVDSILGYHQDKTRQIANGVPKDLYDQLTLKAEAAREILVRFTDFMDPEDVEAYKGKLERHFFALSEQLFFRKIK